MTTGTDYALAQIAAADTGAADNQCPTCGVYRTDGKPPAMHRGKCARTTDDPWLNFPPITGGGAA